MSIVAADCRMQGVSRDNKIRVLVISRMYVSHRRVAEIITLILPRDQVVQSGKMKAERKTLLLKGQILSK
jgi:hypothetical protein